MKKNKITFTIKGDETDVVLAAIKPSAKVLAESQKIYNTVFSGALKSGALLRAALRKYLNEQGIWGEDKQKQYEELTTKIAAGEKQLAEGGIKLKEARNIAIDVRLNRLMLVSLLSEQNSLDNNTVEGQADNARHDYITSECIVYNDTGKKYFASYDDYLNRNEEEAAVVGASKMAAIVHDYDPDFEKSLPEIKFLLEHKLVNDDLQLIDKEGNLVDVGGGKIDASEQKASEQAEVKKPVFLDDEGNPIT